MEIAQANQPGEGLVGDMITAALQYDTCKDIQPPPLKTVVADLLGREHD